MLDIVILKIINIPLSFFKTKLKILNYFKKLER